MANSPNYAIELPTTDTYATDTWAQRFVNILDRALGEFLQRIIVGGVLTGWSLETDKTVTAGEGIVAGCHCKTTGATSISAILVNNTDNYIYAAANATSPEDGTVTFGRVAAPGSIPTGAIQLGVVTVNSGGTVTATDDNPSNCLRDRLVPLRYRQTPATILDLTVAPGESEVVAVDHSSQIEFVVPLQVYVLTTDTVNVTVLANGRSGGGFSLLVANTWEEGQSYGYGDESEVRLTYVADGLV